jgi:hypothetical protein
MAMWDLGVVKAKLMGMGGRVIESGMGTKMGQNMLRNPSLAQKRGMLFGQMMMHSNPAVSKAAQGMIRNQMIKGGLQGAAIGGGLNAARTMGSNAYNDRPLMAGVASAGFRGALAGATIGSNVAPARALMGRNSGAWRGLMGSKAVRPYAASMAQGWKGYRGMMGGFADQAMELKAARAAARAASKTAGAAA